MYLWKGQGFKQPPRIGRRETVRGGLVVLALAGAISVVISEALTGQSDSATNR